MILAETLYDEPQLYKSLSENTNWNYYFSTALTLCMHEIDIFIIFSSFWWSEVFLCIQEIILFPISIWFVCRRNQSNLWLADPDWKPPSGYGSMGCQFFIWNDMSKLGILKNSIILCTFTHLHRQYTDEHLLFVDCYKNSDPRMQREIKILSCLKPYDILSARSDRLSTLLDICKARLHFSFHW